MSGPAGGVEEQVILVDADDRETGAAPKLAVHRAGLLHRAFSVFLTDGKGRLLLQRRARAKYHSAGLWTNTCCGHPRPGESTADAAVRRLHEEMRVTCPVVHVGAFTYRAALGDGLLEHEIDHVFVGRFEGDPDPDPAEADEWRWVPLEDLRRELAEHPHRFTAWFAGALAVVERSAP